MQITAKYTKQLADLPLVFQLKHTKDRISLLDFVHCALVISLAHLDGIMEYGSTPYVGMGIEKNGFPIKCVQNDMFRTQL